MKKLKVFKKLPNGVYIKKQRKYKTKYIQIKKTGLMHGRRKVRGMGDKTGVRRVKKDFVLVKPSKRVRGHVRKISKKQVIKKKTRYKLYEKGQILGRY